ncbi:hypothetical protein SAMN04489844_1544 [Nocardioides exalbidus]|uniref:Uncharacterized protein n=1 Tax=Nocardioides exalbidus TaxID=402596 RepID=A0A1H4P7U9_9ACTN|nr:hypothetical protein [Nocardioides exalbidus]SEC03288.1 hypothetical protein SAMN04489844_1544 [Nocardioides exalbidus]
MSDTTPGAEPTPEPTQPVEPAASTPPPAASTPPSAPGPDYAAQASQAADKLKAGNPLDLGIIGAGLVAFIASLLPFYTVSVEILGTSAGSSANAWHGFLGWFGVLAAVVAAGLLVTRLLGVSFSLPVPLRDAVLGLFAVATLCLLVALFVTPGGGCDDAGIDGLCDGIDIGRGIGYWLALLAAIAGTALSFVRRSAD